MRFLLLTTTFLLTFLLEGVAQTNQPLILDKIPLHEHFDTYEFNGGIQSWSFDQDSTGILYVANNRI